MGGHPYLFFLLNSRGAEEQPTLVDEGERTLAAKPGKSHFLWCDGDWV